MKRKIDEIKTLYHGTDIYHEQIDLRRSNSFKDFGRGYYMTSYRRQAMDWAAVKNRRHKVGESWVFEYELAPVPDGMNVKELLRYNREWLDFIAKRRISGEETPFDIVYDRMADNRFDALSQAVRDYHFGRIDAQRALRIIRFDRRNRDQYCFKTQRAIALLKRTRTYRYENGIWREWKEEPL